MSAGERWAARRVNSKGKLDTPRKASTRYASLRFAQEMSREYECVWVVTCGDEIRCAFDSGLEIGIVTLYGKHIQF